MTDVSCAGGGVGPDVAVKHRPPLQESRGRALDRLAFACVYGADQSLHESSGFSVLPDRVYSATGPVASQRIRPQVATLFVSRTGET